MAEHPIIFQTEMVRAILEGRKTQTRRIVKDNCLQSIQFKKLSPVMNMRPFYKNGDWLYELQSAVDDTEYFKLKCPYGKVGDTLWVKEAWSFIGTGWSSQEPNQETIYVGYKADNSRRDIVLPYDPEKGELCNGLKTPGQNNPYGETTDREAYLDWQAEWWKKQKNKSARFMFRWAARIFLEITNIRVEKVQDITWGDIALEGIREKHAIDTREKFIELWDSLNSKRGYGWDKNPWVWVIEFKRVA